MDKVPRVLRLSFVAALTLAGSVGCSRPGPSAPPELDRPTTVINQFGVAAEAPSDPSPAGAAAERAAPSLRDRLTVPGTAWVVDLARSPQAHAAAASQCRNSGSATVGADPYADCMKAAVLYAAAEGFRFETAADGAVKWSEFGPNLGGTEQVQVRGGVAFRVGPRGQVRFQVVAPFEGPAGLPLEASRAQAIATNEVTYDDAGPDVVVEVRADGSKVAYRLRKP
ncbi:MAG: hypothetical protein EXR79_12030 [Myxococcales bacterium]|nr:hypothetical protein [Myxococcales bacterium]